MFFLLLFKRKSHGQSQSLIQLPNRSGSHCFFGVDWLVFFCNFAKRKIGFLVRQQQHLIRGKLMKYVKAKLVFSCSKSTKLTLKEDTKHFRNKDTAVALIDVIHVFIFNLEHISHFFPRFSITDFKQVNVRWVYIVNI